MARFAWFLSASLTALIVWAGLSGDHIAIEWAGIFSAAVLLMAIPLAIFGDVKSLRMELETGSDIDRQIFLMNVLQVVACLYGGLWKIAMLRIAALLIEEYALRKADRDG